MATGVWGIAEFCKHLMNGNRGLGISSTSKIPGPAGWPGQGFAGSVATLPMLAVFLVFVPPFNTIVDVFPAGIG